MTLKKRTLFAFRFAVASINRDVESLKAELTMEETGTEVYRLSEDERRAVDVALEQRRRGEFVSDGELNAFRNRHKA